MVIYWSDTILKQTLQKNPMDRRRYLQSFVVALEKVPEIECPIEYGCVLRSTLELPKGIKSNNIVFDYVGDPDLRDAYSLMQEGVADYLSHSEFTGKRPRYTFRDGHIRIYATTAAELEMEYIGIQMVTSDYKALKKFKCNGDDDCFNDDVPLNLTNDIIQQTIQAIMSTELRLLPRKNDVDVNVDDMISVKDDILPKAKSSKDD